MSDETVFTFPDEQMNRSFEDTHIGVGEALINMELEAAQKPPALVVVEGESRNVIFDLQTGITTVGRSPDNTIVFNNRGISRKHLRITVSEDHQQVLIKDLGSGNGTIVDEEQLTESLPLMGGEVIDLGGSCVVRFLEKGNVRRIKYDRAQWQANFDPITACYNQDHFSFIVDLWTRRRSLANENICTLLFDIKEMKSIEAQHGTQGVGALMQKAAEYLRANHYRPSDFLARCGDARFGLMTVNTTLKQAVEMATAIQEGLAAQQFAVAGDEQSVTALFGIASPRPEVSEGATLIAQAEEALEEAWQGKGNDGIAYYEKKTGEHLSKLKS